MNTILVLAPHTDDGELGCGGTLARLLEEGHKIYYAAFSICEESVPDGFPKNILESELALAMQQLGIPSEQVITYHYPVRKFYNYRQEILEDLIQLSKDLAVQSVFMPCLHDTHQDHIVIAQEGQRAFKRTTIFCYEMPWNQFDFSSTAFFRLEKRHIERKIMALNQYTTQQGVRNYMDPSFIKGLACVRGTQINAEYAEAFEVVRWIQ